MSTRGNEIVKQTVDKINERILAVSGAISEIKKWAPDVSGPEWLIDRSWRQNDHEGLRQALLEYWKAWTGALEAWKAQQ
jgi:hypothetical protein